jgi:translation initiation factor 3 subunit D
MINQNFSQQVLRKGGKGRKHFKNPNPFFDEQAAVPGHEPASVGYKYRRWTFPDGLRVVGRCELHGTMNKKGKDNTITCYSLNEWDSKAVGTVDWRSKVDSQRGSVLATELKNNSCKLAKWTAQSLLSGADQMAIGFVSRKSKKDPNNHKILGTQFYKPKEFAMQITLSQVNMWGILKMLIDRFMSHPEGKYLLVRDPNKPILRVYKVPQRCVRVRFF